MLIKTGGLRRKIALRDIRYVESRDKKSAIHAKDGEYELRRPLAAIENALGADFYRCHRCYLVNLAQIVSYGPHAIHLENSEKLLLAEKKYAEFVKRYLRYAQEGGIVRV